MNFQIIIERRLENSIKTLIRSSENNLNSFARHKRDLTSPQEALEMNKCLSSCLFVSNSYPSAIFAEMETTARSIWFLTEKFLQFSNIVKTSLASLIASCQIIRSSNLFELVMAVSFAKVKIRTGIFKSDPSVRFKQVLAAVPAAPVVPVLPFLKAAFPAAPVAPALPFLGASVPFALALPVVPVVPGPNTPKYLRFYA